MTTSPGLLNLSPAPATNDARYQQELRRQIKGLEQLAFKKFQDVYIVNGERLILKSSNGSKWSLTVSNSGVVSAVAV